MPNGKFVYLKLGNRHLVSFDEGDTMPPTIAIVRERRTEHDARVLALTLNLILETDDKAPENRNAQPPK